MFAQESVMDFQKEKEAFESWWEVFHNGRQIACDYVEEDNSYSVGYANAQWVAWQAAKAHKAGVVAGTVSRHHHVGLVVGGPLHPVRGLSLPPAGIVRGRVTAGPLVVPGVQERARSQAELGARGR